MYRKIMKDMTVSQGELKPYHLLFSFLRADDVPGMDGLGGNYQSKL